MFLWRTLQRYRRITWRQHGTPSGVVDPIARRCQWSQHCRCTKLYKLSERTGYSTPVCPCRFSQQQGIFVSVTCVVIVDCLLSGREGGRREAGGARRLLACRGHGHAGGHHARGHQEAVCQLRALVQVGWGDAHTTGTRESHLCMRIHTGIALMS